jgi:hypothetical protein
VYTHDGSRFHSVEIFDLDQLDAAQARYEELVMSRSEGVSAPTTTEDSRTRRPPVR